MLYDPKWEKQAETPTNKILVEARRLIERPEYWCQTYSDGISICAVHALHRALKNLGLSSHDEEAAYDALARGMRLPTSDGPEMGHWNDALGRTHAEVLAAFDRAIAAARS